MELYDIFSQHLNIVQVYMFSRAYIVPNTPSLKEILSSLISISHEEAIVKDFATEHLKDIYAPALVYMDSHRDRQVLKGLMAELTNTSFASRLQGLHNRKGTASARKQLASGLQQYADIRRTSQMVRSDLIVVQQHKLTERIISVRKLKEIRTIGEGRGRKLKTTQFPELATVLLYAFGEYDIKEDGGGVEAHPRLTTGTLYRAVDNVTTMKAARDIILSLAPSSFKISLSSATITLKTTGREAGKLCSTITVEMSMPLSPLRNPHVPELSS